MELKTLNPSLFCQWSTLNRCHEDTHRLLKLSFNPGPTAVKCSYQPIYALKNPKKQFTWELQGLLNVFPLWELFVLRRMLCHGQLIKGTGLGVLLSTAVLKTVVFGAILKAEH